MRGEEATAVMEVDAVKVDARTSEPKWAEKGVCLIQGHARASFHCLGQRCRSGSELRDLRGSIES